MKILVIDDDNLVLYTLTRILERNGYQVVTATDGRRAIAIFRDERPDVVITDIVMPEQDGSETIMLLRQQRPEGGVIAISGGARTRNLDYLKRAGPLRAAGVLRKPLL